MAGSEQEQDRNEPATPFKLREARKRGQVAKSIELTAWLIVLAAALFAYGFADGLVRSELGLSTALFEQSGEIALDRHNALRIFSLTIWRLFADFWLLLGLIVVVGMAANFAQTGPVFSWVPLKPDFNRLNPAAGFKRLFNARILFEAVKTLLKIALLSAAVYTFVATALPELMTLLQLDTRQHVQVLLQQSLALVFLLLAVLAVTMALDFGYVKWDFGKKMRMSRRELKEEVKRRDGDPQIKARIRELQREALRRSGSLNRVAEADVVITNPTHLSVAVQYRRGEMPAPIVIAKGAGELALRMRSKARQCGVPVVENRGLARTLFKRVGLDQSIAPETYIAVAKLLTVIYRERAH